MKDASLPHPLPDPLTELIAQRFRVLSDPMRIKLLDLLRDSPAIVSELTQAAGTSQQNVSKHLGVLYQAGMVAREKQGNSSRYYVVDPGIYTLCEQVCGGLRKQLDELGQLLGDRHGAA